MGSIDPQVALPEKFEISLPVTAEIQRVARPSGAVALAHAYEIDSNEVAQLANGELQSVKVRLTQLKTAKEGFVAPARQILENAANVFNAAIEDCTAAEGIYKAKLLEWQEKERRRVEEENRQREEAARIARQKAEQEAAAARARAEQEAAEARRKAAEAEQARLKAVSEGNAKAAATAAAAAAKAQEQAQAALENGEAKATAAAMGAAALETAAPAAAPTKLAGFSTRDNWKAELADGFSDDRAKLAILNAIVIDKRTDLLGLVLIDTKAINKLSTALKKAMNVPGYQAVNKPIASSSAR